MVPGSGVSMFLWFWVLVPPQFLGLCLHHSVFASSFSWNPSPCLCGSINPSPYKDTSHCIRAHPYTVGPHINLVTFQKPYFEVRPHSQVLWLGLNIVVLGTQFQDAGGGLARDFDFKKVHEEKKGDSDTK